MSAMDRFAGDITDGVIRDAADDVDAELAQLRADVAALTEQNTALERERGELILALEYAKADSAPEPQP